jgi:hypothetical protein
MKIRMRIVIGAVNMLALAGVAIAAFACAGREKLDVSPDACDDYADARCSLRGRCEPNSLRERYGDLRTCRAREAMSCRLRSSAPGTGWKGGAITKCASANRSASCAYVTFDTLLDECFARGELADGELCADREQCAGGTCAYSTTDAGLLANCGTCGSAPRAVCGGADFGTCPSPRFCQPQGDAGTSYGCISRGAEGDACAVNTCQDGLFCDQGACAKVAGAGEPCVWFVRKPLVDSCDHTQGLACFDTVCETTHFALPGEPCGSVGISCEAGAACRRPDGSTSSVCVAPLPDGAPCLPLSGAPCMFPADCWQGTCQTHAPSPSCP